MQGKRQADPGGRCAAGGSTLDHCFGGSPPFTIGIEEEYMLLDPVTLDLVQRASGMLETDGSRELSEQLSAEVFQSELEAHTTVCRGVGELGREIRRIRGQLRGVAHEQGLRLGLAGTHPFSLFEQQQVTRKERYEALIEELQYVVRRELIFGLHVHVAVDGPDKAMHVLRALLPHLSELVALTASSPFWRGVPTGLVSTRQTVFAAFPRSGLPPYFRDYAEFADAVGRLESAGSLPDYTYIWWDARPHPRFGTIEVRVMDAVARVDDVVALVAYVQALVKRYSEGFDQGERLPFVHPMLSSENKWLAARYGLDASLVDVAAGTGSVTAAQSVGRTLREIAAHARELGCERELEGIERILVDGNGASAQLRVFRETNDVAEVAREIAATTEADTAVAA